MGEGPMRFGPVRQECSVQIQAERRGLSKQDILNFAGIKAEWETKYRKEAKSRDFTNEQLLRIAIFCNFDVSRSINLMRKTRRRFFELSAIDEMLGLGEQLQSRTLFPCPGLKTSEGADVFYMRPSRYFPKETKVSLVIDNLIYVMDKLVLQKEGHEDEDTRRTGGETSNTSGKNKNDARLAFIANMEGWTMANFSTEYCRKFMMVLQGQKFPAKVSMFLILNPPSWFHKVWRIMRPMLSASFAKKVHMITEDELPYFMSLDYEEYLPDDVRGGKVETDHLVRDFCLFHQSLERATRARASSNKNILRQQLSGIFHNNNKKVVVTAAAAAAPGGPVAAAQSKKSSIKNRRLMMKWGGGRAHAAAAEAGAGAAAGGRQRSRRTLNFSGHSSTVDSSSCSMETDDRC